MHRKSSIVTGLLFILCTMSGVWATVLLGNVKEITGLTELFQNQGTYTVGALLILTMAFSAVGIAVSIYPVIKDRYPALAIGAVAFRVIEGALMAVSSIIYMGLLAVYQSNALTRESAVILLELRPFFSSYGAAMAFALGALLYYIAFFKSGIVPEWLSVWGLIAILLHMMAIVFVAFGHEPFAPHMMVLNLPIALQEMVFAMWLIIKGYSGDRKANT